MLDKPLSAAVCQTCLNPGLWHVCECFLLTLHAKLEKKRADHQHADKETKVNSQLVKVLYFPLIFALYLALQSYEVHSFIPKCKKARLFAYKHF